MKILKVDDEKYLDEIVSAQLAMAEETEGLKLNEDVVRKGVGEVISNPARGCYYITLDQETDFVIGTLLTIPEWSDWRCAEVLWIHSVYVSPAFRGKGVFKNLYFSLKSMVNSGESYAGLRLYVDKTNQKAIEVYKKIGMSDQHYTLFEWLK